MHITPAAGSRILHANTPQRPEVRPPAQAGPGGVHAHRTPRGDRDHRHFGGHVIARLEQGQNEGAGDLLHEQS